MAIKILKWGIWILAFVCAVVFYFYYTWPLPPVKEIKAARESLLEAEKLKAATYAIEEFKQAKEDYDRAILHWQKENDRLFIRRDFSMAKQYAINANENALIAIKTARYRSSDSKTLASALLADVQKQLEDYQKIFVKIDLGKKQMQELSRAKLLLFESQQAFDRSNYQEALKKAESAERIIHQTTLAASNILAQYLESYPEWSKWVEKSIKYSKKQKTVSIVVDKYARQCLLYKNGVLQKTYSIELGSNWIGDKNYQGDMTTPEGSYKITEKRSVGQTKFHKALVLNYPNEDDVKRFRLNLKKGLIKKDAAIGGGIEIHGQGGSGLDWTQGCIALSNGEMDELFSYCNIGTEVIIIGSIKPYEEIVKTGN